jgi:hypothetical protein
VAAVPAPAVPLQETQESFEAVSQNFFKRIVLEFISFLVVFDLHVKC